KQQALDSAKEGLKNVGASAGVVAAQQALANANAGLANAQTAANTELAAAQAAQEKLNRDRADLLSGDGQDDAAPSMGHSAWGDICEAWKRAEKDDKFPSFKEKHSLDFKSAEQVVKLNDTEFKYANKNNVHMKLDSSISEEDEKDKYFDALVLSAREMGMTRIACASKKPEFFERLEKACKKFKDSSGQEMECFQMSEPKSPAGQQDKMMSMAEVMGILKKIKPDGTIEGDLTKDQADGFNNFIKSLDCSSSGARAGDAKNIFGELGLDGHEINGFKGFKIQKCENSGAFNLKNANNSKNHDLTRTQKGILEKLNK
ncbi:MAG: hypothetical protein FWF01_04620, partial [Alphaproteobacteria bacterium]|nr:hypothetical protein [Alphaproteobacteria bacterium]